MSRFSGVLRRAAERLDLPQPIKSQVLLEMAADLDDLYSVYRQRGLDEDEAASRVTEKFDASDDTLHELTLLHRSVFHRWMDRFSTQAQTLWERVILVAVLLFIAGITGRMLLSTEFFRNANGFVWPAIGIGLVATGIFLAKVYQFHVKKDHRTRDLRRWLPTLLLLACASLLNGLLGFFLLLQLTMMRIAENQAQAGPYLMDWMVGSTATMILSLLVTILVAVLWFVLMNQVQRIELAEAEVMLETSR